MKLLRALLLVVGLLVLLGICSGGNSPGSSTIAIKVSGDPGLRFSGSYLVTNGVSSTSTSVDGRVPAEYVVNGDIVSAVFQNKGASGTLRVELVRGGRLVGQAETTAAYGVVSVAGQ